MSDHGPADRLRQLWNEGRCPDLDQFLQAEGPSDTLELAAILRVDQAGQWANGTPIPAEEYLRRYPAAASNPEAALDLIHNEYLLTERQGQKLDVEEFANRFPEFAETIRLQIDLHHAVADVATVDGDSPEGPETRSLDHVPIRTNVLDLPKQFGRYQILDILGRGGMGTVYSAFDSKLERRVALKVPKFGSGDEVRISRFLREAKVAAGLSDRHLCPVYDVGELGGIHYLTMPIIEGETLGTRIQREGKLSIVDAVRLTKTIARALGVAHAAGVIHRDLKPANIMIDRAGQPIVTDFGLARSRSSIEQGITSSGMFVGTPAYAAPEQFGSSDSVTPATDVYALGSIMFELLTGRTPFAGPIEELIRSKLQGDSERPSQYRSGLHNSVDEVCRKALRHSSKDRFASMDEFAEALERCDVSARQSKPNRRRALFAAGILLTSIVVIAIAFWPKKVPVLAAQDPLPVDSIWIGELSFAPTVANSWEPALLWVTHREGKRFQGLAETKDGDYAWKVQGTVEDDRIAWKYASVVREQTATHSVDHGATAEGRFDGTAMELRYFDPGDGTRAEIKLRLLDRDTRAALARVDRAWKLNDSQQLEASIEMCNLALKLDDRCVNALICRSNASIQRRAFQSAIADLDRAIEIEPTNHMAYVDRSWARNSIGDYDGSLDDAERAVSLKPRNAETYYQRGCALEGKKNYARAIEDFSTAIELRPNYTLAFLQRGKAYKIVGKAELASKDFAEAKRLEQAK